MKKSYRHLTEKDRMFLRIMSEKHYQKEKIDCMGIETIRELL